MTTPEQENHFVITCTNGDVRIRRLTEAAAVGVLELDDEDKLIDVPFRWDEKFDPDPMYWDDFRCLIIRGTVVTPHPVAVKYELR